MLGINSQLVEIDLNRHLSRTVRNLASPNIVVSVLWNDRYDEHEITTLAMVIIVMLLNDIPHVWHRLVANLEMNSYNCRRTDQFIRAQVQWQPASGRTVILEPI